VNRAGQITLMSGLLLFQAGAAEHTGVPAARSELPSAAGFEPRAAAGLHNVFRVAPNLYSGSAPEGAAGFDSLQKLGIKTVITVDGVSPEVEEAHKHGMRYIHLPHGYDGIPRATQILLAKATQNVEGPIYVHCHHGSHRGPAAVAVICRANFGWSAQQSLAWMHAAGTATNYVGLYRAAELFQPMTDAELRAAPSKFPEKVKVSGLVEAMVAVDTRMDLLKEIRAAGFKTPASHPDLAPANEALLLKETFRELQRLPEAQKRGAKFLSELKSAEDQAEEAERLLQERVRGDGKSFDDQKLIQQFSAIEKRCSSCHERFRN